MILLLVLWVFSTILLFSDPVSGVSFLSGLSVLCCPPFTAGSPTLSFSLQSCCNYPWSDSQRTDSHALRQEQGWSMSKVVTLLAKLRRLTNVAYQWTFLLLQRMGACLQDIHQNKDHLLLMSCFLYLTLSTFLLLLANYSCLVNKARRLDIGEGTLGYTSIHPPQGTVQQLSGGESGELKNEHYIKWNII